jgi:6-phospho-beta-glucosidase
MLKVAVIGAGSTYTPELVNGFLERVKTFPMDELWLMDINTERLETVGGFAKRMVEAKGSPFKVILSQDQREAVRNANYVITQLRVGMMQARVSDEYLGRRHGLIGQETTGVGGMAKALRTIPVILSIAYDMHELAAPGAMLINFTNPSGLVTEALFRYAPEIPAVGVCNIPLNTKMEIIKKLEKLLLERIDPSWVELKTLGLNHLSWHYGLTIKGEDMWPPIIDNYIDDLRSQEEPEWDPDTIAALRMMPNPYLKYYYDTGRKLAEQQSWPPSRGETVMEIEKGLLRQYADPALTEPPPELMQRGGAYYSTVATQLLNALYNDLGETHVCNVRQNGAVSDWDKDWVLELPCKVDAKGIHPLPAEPLPPVCYGLLAQVKSYELLTVEAAVHGDRRAAYQALLVHPLGPASGQAQTVLEDMIKTNQTYLPQF